MRQRTIGNALVLVGLLVMVGGFLSNSALASDTDGYAERVTNIEGSRTRDAAANTTTFVFKVTFERTVSHVLIASCPENASVKSSTGPDGSTMSPNGRDGSTDHRGVKYTPGVSGTYTIVFDGDISGADFIVKESNGHKHFSMGTGCSGTAVSTSSSSSSSTTASTEPTTTTMEPTTTTMEPTTTTLEPTTTSSSSTSSTTEATILPGIEETTSSSSPTSSSAPTPTTEPPSTSSTDATVLGSQLENPANTGTGTGADVLGSQEEQGAVGGATIPRTGGEVGGYLLLAGLALLLGGLAIRFGQVEEPAQA
jgi:hypothetical protein